MSDVELDQRCERCNGGGTLEGSHCTECGQRRYDDTTCPDCNGSGLAASREGKSQ